MKKFRFLTALFALSALTACVGSKPAEPAWLDYRELDGNIRAISFMQIQGAETQKNAKQGEAWQIQDGKPQMLGDIYYIYDVHDRPLRVAFLHKGQSVNPHEPAAFDKLKSAQELDLYEFGNGRIGHTRFKAAQGLCADFEGKQGVGLRMMTNYYVGENQYFSNLIIGTLFSHKKPTDLGYKAYFTIKDEGLLAKIQSEERQQGKRLALANLKEKLSILAGVVCKNKG